MTKAPALRILSWLFVSLVLLSGCAGMGKGNDPAVIDTTNTQRLYGRIFELNTLVVNGSSVVMHVDGKMTLGFSPQGQAAGFGAANKFAGEYSFTPKGELKWSERGLRPVTKTGPPELLEKEKIYLDALRRTTRAVEGRRGLVLQTDDESTVLTFVEVGY